jgi:glutaconyl-CoA/methylmalonyl-CoA decarboxylase subunit gamma
MKLRVKVEDQTFEVEVGSLQARPITAVIDGETFEVWPEEAQGAAPVQAAPAFTPAPAPMAAPAPAAAARPAAPAAGKASVVAPIPGTVIAVKVKEGQQVNQGDELITLEAMKMKSAIRSNRAGKIGRILVAAGDKVTQNQAMIEFGE